MKHSKSQLEELISREKTLGNYVFDESEQCFYGDAEVELYISKLNDTKYRSELFYFDGYEVYLEDEQKDFFEGDFETAKQKAIDSYNSRGETFMDYPVIYTHVTCHLLEES